MKTVLKMICLLLALALLCGCADFAAPGRDIEGAGEGNAPIDAPAPVEGAARDTAVTVTLAGDGLNGEQQELVTTLLARWYRFIGTFEEQDYAPLFSDSDQARTHAAACRTLSAIRAAAPEDLHLIDCAVSLRVDSVTADDAGLTANITEDTLMHFSATAGVDSYLYAMPHIFRFEETAEGWRIVHHEADDNPFFSYTDDPEGDVDANLDTLLANIAARPAPADPTPAPEADHPYDRAAALAYMTEYAHHRNPDFYAYDAVGGNCMNFGSQVLLAGGIPMDAVGDATWRWLAPFNTTGSFINVNDFEDYARTNTGFGLVATVGPDDGAGQVGDLLLLGIDGPRHTTVISGFVTDGSGKTVDYLLCSNTTNYRDFPAAAYYYTSRTLAKIHGWND